MIYYFLILLWFIPQLKASLFWLYLWQLKEYHIGRFIDHFRTEKGKRLLFNPLTFFKIAIFSIFLILGFISFEPGFLDMIADFLLIFLGISFFLVYFLDALNTAIKYFSNKISKPVFTKKVQFLSLVLLILTCGFLFFVLRFSSLPLLLLFDILTPLIVSLVVLVFQPFTALWRGRIIKKAKRKRNQFKKLLVIGITGSYGKTSTKEFLATILSEKFKVLKTKEHQNSEVGISRCILEELKPEEEIFVVEMGAYNRGGIKLLSDIVKPKIGILTGINEQHLATFGSLENIIKTKYELIESLPEDGIAFFNAKNKYCLELYQKTKIKKFLYGKEAKFLGEENILGAIAVAKELGMSKEEISRACQKIGNKFPGIELKEGIGGLKIIDATYSANPDGVIAHLEYLKTFPGKKVIVMPCLIELGKASKEIHQRIGQKIGQVCNLAIITTKERFKEIKDGSASSPQEGTEVLFIKNPKEILEKIKRFCQPGDMVLLESRVPPTLIPHLTYSSPDVE
jgi:UDP-N-acetylmuramoyl-tripeptide--D-alanyl-D-alanine ligase